MSFLFCPESHAANAHHEQNLMPRSRHAGSAAEKAKIAQLAQNAAQGAKIDNQLEVKAAE